MFSVKRERGESDERAEVLHDRPAAAYCARSGALLQLQKTIAAGWPVEEAFAAQKEVVGGMSANAGIVRL